MTEIQKRISLQINLVLEVTITEILNNIIPVNSSEVFCNLSIIQFFTSFKVLKNDQFLPVFKLNILEKKVTELNDNWNLVYFIYIGWVLMLLK